MLGSNIAMQFNTRIYGKFATGAKYAVQKVAYECDLGDLYVGDVVQHRDKVFVEVCPDINELISHDIDWTEIPKLLQPLLAPLGITAMHWDGCVGGLHDGGCYILLK